MIICKCGHQNSDESLFCSECGSSLSKTCPFCHADLARNSKFCQNCGKSVAEPAAADSSAFPNGSVVAGDVHTTIIYNQENKNKEKAQASSTDVLCQICGKKLPQASLSNLQCSVCGMHFCSDHFDARSKMCYRCYEKDLAAFEYHRFDNGKYAITGVKNKDSLSIVIPDCVEAIEDEAFLGCNMLTVTFPPSLLKIGNRAFAECRSLTTARLPKGVKIIGDEAFLGCEKLNYYTMGCPYGISVGANAFLGTIGPFTKPAKSQNSTMGAGASTSTDSAESSSASQAQSQAQNQYANETPEEKRKRLEQQRSTNLIVGVVCLFFCWPVSIYFFLNMNRIDKEIKGMQ